jgi:cytochrome c556
MTLKVSTGLRNKLMDTGSLKTIMAAGLVKIYSGAIPADADAAVTGSIVCTVSQASAGTGVNFDTSAAAGVISKAPAETWSGVNAATATATYYRHVAASDDGTLSTTQARLQGAVATVGSDLNLSSVALVSGATQTIDYYSVTLPAA